MRDHVKLTRNTLRFPIQCEIKLTHFWRTCSHHVDKDDMTHPQNSRLILSQTSKDRPYVVRIPGSFLPLTRTNPICPILARHGTIQTL